MKLKFIYSLLITSISSFSQGQDRYFGFRLGMNNAFVSPTATFENMAIKLGFAGGLTYEQFFKEKFSLGADLLFTQRGFALISAQYPFDPVTGYSNGSDQFPIKFRHDYLSIPLHARIYFGKKFFGFGGLHVSPSILVRFKNDFLQDSTLRESSRPDLFDFGGQLELGCGFKLADDLHIFFSIARYQGFTKVNNENYYATNDFRNANTNISIGVKFRMQHKLINKDW